MTKSHVPAANTSAQIDIPEGQLANESKKRLNDSIEHNAYAKAYVEQGTPEEIYNKEVSLEEAQVPKNSEISISYVHK